MYIIKSSIITKRCNTLENKQSIVILTAIVLVVAVAGFIINLSTSTTGQYTYAGGWNKGWIQYSYPQEACEYIECENGPAVFKGTVGGDAVWDPRLQFVECYCPENPNEIIATPMTYPVSSGGYIMS